jgi:hypothetical protein
MFFGKQQKIMEKEAECKEYGCSYSVPNPEDEKDIRNNCI